MYYSEDTVDRSTLTRRIYILGWITLIISIICIVLGIVSVSVSESRADFPFSAGGAMIAGIPALILSCCPMYLYSEDKKYQGGNTTCCFNCCLITMVVWFSVTIITICVGFGLAGIHGVVVCTNEAEKLKACSSAAGTKLAISWVTIIATLILFFLSLAIFFTCCCNAAKFGMPLLGTSYSTDYYNNTIERSREMRRQQEVYSIERSREMRRQQNIVIESLSEDRHRSQVGHTNNVSNIPTDISDIRQQRTEINVLEETGPFSVNSQGMDESRYSDLPPSYEEVMKLEENSEAAI